MLIVVLKCDIVSTCSKVSEFYSQVMCQNVISIQSIYRLNTNTNDVRMYHRCISWCQTAPLHLVYVNARHGVP